jgi:hypothetical protein
MEAGFAGTGRAVYAFTLDAEDSRDYVMRALVRGETDAADTFFVSFDGGPRQTTCRAGTANCSSRETS